MEYDKFMREMVKIVVDRLRRNLGNRIELNRLEKLRDSMNEESFIYGWVALEQIRSTWIRLKYDDVISRHDFDELLKKIDYTEQPDLPAGLLSRHLKKQLEKTYVNK